jgi:hypothetical protein
LLRKKVSLMRNCLAEQEGFINKKLSYRAREVKVSLFKIKSLHVKLSYRTKKRLSFMLLIINKCFMTIELSVKGRNPIEKVENYFTSGL